MEKATGVEVFYKGAGSETRVEIMSVNGGLQFMAAKLQGTGENQAFLDYRYFTKRIGAERWAKKQLGLN